VAHFHSCSSGPRCSAFRGDSFLVSEMFGRMMNETVGRSISCCRSSGSIALSSDAPSGNGRVSAKAGRSVQLSLPRTPPADESVHHLQRDPDGRRAVLLIGNFLYSIFKGPKVGVIRGTPTDRMDGSFASRAREFRHPAVVYRGPTNTPRPGDEDFLRRRGISRTKNGTPIRM